MSMRRLLLSCLPYIISALLLVNTAYATESEDDDLHFPGDPTDHNVVFQLNRDDLEYHQAVLTSVSELKKKYGDNITIVVTAFGKGIHVLAKKPVREVSAFTQQRIKSLASYGVIFHACGNTMNTLKWTKQDMLPFVEVVKVGAADIIELQEKGYSYLSW